MLTDTTRKMASIRTIAKLSPIENSDFLEVAEMENLGWKVVVKKGEFVVGQKIIYFEIDSAINVKDLAEPLKFLAEKGTKKLFTGRTPDTSTFSEEYVRIKTIKLRGQVSQGLIIPIPNGMLDVPNDPAEMNRDWEGEDFTAVFHVEVWDRLVEWFEERSQLGPGARGSSSGNFPSDVPKTDEVRCLDGSTRISLKGHELSIKDVIQKIKNGEDVEVESFNIETQQNELRPVIGYNISPASSTWMKITLDDGTVLKCTSNHRIFLPMLQAYRKAQDLTVGDIIQKQTK